ncbi:MULTISPECIES: hypothetical protein [Clostridium]|jgi:hypothetical protein|uniref:STAS domain-containing protein n=3 Tax=Clostridium TaxID=1485 RepID=A0A0B5QSM1_CLOBE|nr:MULTISPECIES: hypothetical protein [Clostridium]AVK48027.1 hypothetical protein AXY43_08310 [Clostridium sp. MF28]ABR36143.1 hypothetical protein Cbei_4033 [Clostridium beijerinckii NCIMB 8052]AIU05150.1 hypothetical protein Cbs_4033 [Clostridium beijerinckii ATCC 35702]AJH01073.1 hypothetical protein LF65_04538 [Clostridium beijerinckii]ALB44804.1 hypothetical protein X276_05680 [Clostridium beijerinckii NRRL B-598]
MKKYQLSLDKAKKEINIRIWGMFEPNDANSFVEDFRKELSPIQTSEYVLNFDARELNVSRQEMLPMLEGCFQMYKACKFVKVIANVGSNITLKMQLSRISRNTGLVIEII